MDADHIPVGRVLSRRDVLELLGAAGALALGGFTASPAFASPVGAFPSWVVRPEMTEGPYVVDEQARPRRPPLTLASGNAAR